jgi:hypothetical protein
MEPDFESCLRKGLDEARLATKRFLHDTGRGAHQVMDPNVDLAQLEKKMVWGADPVHPQQLAYNKMASGLKIVEAKIGKRRSSVGDRGMDKKTRTEAGRERPAGGRPKQQRWRLEASGPLWQLERQGSEAKEGRERPVGTDILII